MRGLKLLYITIPVSILIGIAWGIKLHRERGQTVDARASGRQVRVLSIAGLLSKDLISRFEAENAVHVALTEVANPEEIWTRLEKIPTSPTESFDLVSVFSYQVPLAMQMTRLQPIDGHRLRKLNSISPDFRGLPGETSLRSVVPLLWGLFGMVFDEARTREPGSWKDAFQDPSLKGKIAIPAAATEIARIAGVSAEAKDLKKLIQPLLSSVEITENFLSPGSAFTASQSPVVALMSHGEMVFQKFSPASRYRFYTPDEGVSLWFLALALSHEASNEREAYQFLDFLLRPNSSLALVKNLRQATTNRELESSSELDPRLKASYVRKVALDKIVFAKDMNRAREIRALLEAKF